MNRKSGVLILLLILTVVAFACEFLLEGKPHENISHEVVTRINQVSPYNDVEDSQSDEEEPDEEDEDVIEQPAGIATGTAPEKQASSA